MTTPSKSGDDALQKALIAFLRDSLAERYSLENIRLYYGFDGIPDEHAEALRDFGLRYIYPEWEERRFQDAAFEKLMDLLASPRRLSPLTAVALKSLFRFGRNLPKAVDAGKQVINAFEATRQLEQQLQEHIRAQQPDSLDRAFIGQAAARGLAAIGKQQFEAFVDSLVSLMELLNQRALLTTGASVLQDIAAAMQKRPDAYSEIELEGTHYAVEVMNEGMALFDALDNDAVMEAIGAIPAIEHDWFDKVVGEADE